jgi:rhodanese-related sulfurtransferase
MLGFDYIFRGDHTAVFVDARTPAEHATATVPGAVNVQKGEATAANDDGRLPFTDKGTRVVVFGNTADQASVVAAEIAKKAYWNSSYFGGTLADLVAAGFINHPPVALSKNAIVAAGPYCTAAVTPAAIDGGSFDVDSGDTLALSVDPATPLALGQHTVSLVATDSRGVSRTATAVATVADQSGPVISGLAVDPPALWPPNRTLTPVTVAYMAADNCGSTTTELLVSSSDSPGGNRLDAQVVDAHHLLLGADAEREYLVTVVATDTAGNTSASSVAIRVGVPSR